MFENYDKRWEVIWHKVQFILVGALSVVILFLCMHLVSGIATVSAQARNEESATDTAVLNAYESPNLITSGAVSAAARFKRATDSTASSLNNGAKAATSAASQTGRFAANGGKFVVHGAYSGVVTAARGVGSGLAFTGRTVGGGLAFAGHKIGDGLAFSGRSVSNGAVVLINIPGRVLGSLSKAPAISAFIRPAEDEDMPAVPIIDPASPALIAALTALPAAKAADQPASQKSPVAVWPLRGEITTSFGVDHRPYQVTHTGIDISDGEPSGVTPVKPFRPGRVIETVRSNRGLGNHVVVDHGNGVTSVYAHLASISVQQDQEVGTDTTLGLQGTTGVSTGTHLHFEIRVNGQAADPRQFITGLPS